MAERGASDSFPIGGFAWVFGRAAAPMRPNSAALGTDEPFRTAATMPWAPPEEAYWPPLQTAVSKAFVKL
jgi:hypothetical protein